MSLPPSVAQLQREHVVMELECIDRMYLNAYIPKLTTEERVIRPGLSLLQPRPPETNTKLSRAFQQFQTELTDYFAQQKAA